MSSAFIPRIASSRTSAHFHKNTSNSTKVVFKIKSEIFLTLIKSVHTYANIIIYNAFATTASLALMFLRLFALELFRDDVNQREIDDSEQI